MSKFVAEETEFLNKPLLSIYEVKDGVKSEKPVISFGNKKAKAILAVIKEIEKFVGGKDD